jgi:hypothetical protein
MASAKLAPILDDLIGSVGPDTFAHTRAVLVCKGKSWPGSKNVFIPSASQLAIRDLFDIGATNWNLLNGSQIEAWNALALQVTWYNKFQEAYHPSGQQLYCSCMMNMKLIGKNIYNDAPARPNVAHLASFSVTYSTSGADNCMLQFPGQTTPATTRTLIYSTISSPIGRSYPGNLYRFVDIIPVNTPDTYDFTAGYTPIFGPLVTTLKIFTKLIPIDLATGFSDDPLLYTAIVDA